MAESIRGLVRPCLGASTAAGAWLVRFLQNFPHGLALCVWEPWQFWGLKTKTMWRKIFVEDLSVSMYVHVLFAHASKQYMIMHGMYNIELYIYIFILFLFSYIYIYTCVALLEHIFVVDKWYCAFIYIYNIMIIKTNKPAKQTRLGKHVEMHTSTRMNVDKCSDLCLCVNVCVHSHILSQS